jgi:hypothetical protein
MMQDWRSKRDAITVGQEEPEIVQTFAPVAHSLWLKWTPLSRNGELGARVGGCSCRGERHVTGDRGAELVVVR